MSRAPYGAPDKSSRLDLECSPRKKDIHLDILFRGKHETGFEPATLALARRYSTTEPLVRNKDILAEK